MWQDPAIPQMLDHSLVLVPDWWEYIYIKLLTMEIADSFYAQHN
jgi:hypothetical protein